MDPTQPIPENKILTLVYRVEPGCLGPEGISQIEDFCQFAQSNISTASHDFLSMKIIPRYDKTISELQYQINQKILSQDQVVKYLSIFKQDISSIEDGFLEEIANLIEKYTTN